MNKLETIDCPVCQSNQYNTFLIGRDYLYSKENFSIVKCSKCGVLYTNPRVKESEISNYYFTEYSPHREPKQLSPFRRIVKKTALFFGNSHSRLLKTLLSYDVKTVLEIGPGSGALLSFLNKSGLMVAGIELDKRCAESIRKNNIVCFHGDLNEVVEQIRPQKFDAIILFHVFEHLYEPVKTLNNIYSLLNDGGIVYISVPDTSSVEARMFGKFWRGLDLPRHVIHYDSHTLKQLLSAEKFEVLKSQSEPFPSSVLESLGFMLFKSKMPLKLYYLLYYPWRLLYLVYMKLVGTGCLNIIVRKL